MTVSPAAAADFSVSRLCEVPSFAPALAEAHAREWGHLYAHWNQATALADFRLEKVNSDLPTTWVAHHSSGILLGSISLVLDDLPDHPGLNPWLASLYVFPKFRGRGLGKLLVRQALGFLHQIKCPHACLFTEDQVPFFSKLGFVIHHAAQANGYPISILKWTSAEFSPSGGTAKTVAQEREIGSRSTAALADMHPQHESRKKT